VRHHFIADHASLPTLCHARQADELINPFAAAHPWLYKHYQQQRDNADVIRTAAGEKKLFERDGPAQEAVLNFKLLLNGPQHVRGVGLEVRIGNGHPIRVLFDSGASGIFLRQSVIDKAGLAHMGKDEVHGVGDSGPRNIFYSVPDTCQIDTLRFRNCLVNALKVNAPLRMKRRRAHRRQFLSGLCNYYRLFKPATSS